MPTNAVTPYINVARIVRAHGKKGEVVVAPLDGLPFCLEPGMRVCLTPPDLEGERFRTVLSVNDRGPADLIAFSGVASISDAEALVGKLVLASRADVPDVVREQSVLSCVGRSLVDTRHGDIGVVEEVMQLPANDVWRVEGPFGELLVPVIPDVVDEDAIPAHGPIEVHLLDGIVPDEAQR
ncbi:MAG: 16S rRNA processing protein RimM [Coriobacteriia bacterium]|nr:16S rRNA processing protein RimM [Coriobacteriia bacterium]